MADDQEQTKKRLRRAMRAARAQLPADEVARCSAAACERVVALPAFEQAAGVVAYVARDNELDPRSLVEAALRAGKPIYYPSPDGRFRAADGALSASPDVVFIVPGLAFDLRGARLGRGGGWYDRALAGHGRGIRLGLAFDFQVVPDLPEAVWDVRMDVVVTEARLVTQPPEPAWH